VVSFLFQSPSLRGSGRFLGELLGLADASVVSIPFIAGQWSLHTAREHARTNLYGVSIPFIAGQWSLPWSTIRTCKEFVWFQSPSLRGSGRFFLYPQLLPQVPRVSIPFIAGQWSLLSLSATSAASSPCFNPLHCGAVVASRRSRRGAVRRCEVSIPFIAGQWSLHRAQEAKLLEDLKFQSPSLRGSGRFSIENQLESLARLRVSIPFIAGQWSLLTPMAKTKTKTKSFNPLHCGAVVASPAVRRLPRPAASGFNPLHCGAVVASRDARLSPDDLAEFQSPSLRGSGRFTEFGSYSPWKAVLFQSPSLRGSGRFITAESNWPSQEECFNPLHCGAVVASRPRTRARRTPPLSFNPLHCGAVVASEGARRKK